MVCPDSAIHRDVKYYVIEYDYCKGCGICANECPRKAIAMVPEEK
jgi:pyruvate ferredoxin oxidoreductase delta subunit